jgi:serine/threonine-protein kinase
MSGSEPHLIYEFGEFRLDASRRLLFVKGTSDAVAITPKVFETILYFVERPGVLLEKNRLLADLWPGLVVEENSLTQVISMLRRVLGETRGENRYLVTVSGHGYRFVADVMRLPQPLEANRDVTAAVAPAQADRRPSRRAAHIALVALLCVAGAMLFTYGWYAQWWRASEVRPPTAESLPAATGLPARTVAILPFENLSTAPADEYVAFGVAESVLHRLAGIRGLSLIARTSSFAYQDKPTDVREIGRTLNARYLVEGSVQRSGERLRVTAQLIDAETGGHVWSLRFDREIDDIFAVEDEIAQGVARALEVSLGPETHPYAQYGTDAYLAFMQGRALVASRKVADAERAIERFSQAVRIAPTFAAAYVALADAHLHLAQVTDDSCSTPNTRAAHQRAQPMLERALALDDSLGEAYVLRADLKACSGDSNGAEADFRKGLVLSPSYGWGHQRLAHFLFERQRTAQALAAIDRARSIDPLTPRNHYLKGLMRQTEGAIKEAEALYLQSLAVAPDFHPALMRLATIRAYQQGRFAEGLKLAEQAVAIDARPAWMLQRPVALYLELEDVDAARTFVAQQPQSERPALWVPICLFERQVQRAADILRANPDRWSDSMTHDVEAYVIRDSALANGQFARAQDALNGLPVRPYGSYGTIALAQVKLALGDRRAAENLAREVLAQQNPKSNTRAIALALLGQHTEALEQLEQEFERGWRRRWWYVFDREPAFEPLRNDPRFQALAARARAHAGAQRRLLEQMRERGEVPRRVPSAIPAAAPC